VEQYFYHDIKLINKMKKLAIFPLLLLALFAKAQQVPEMDTNRYATRKKAKVFADSASKRVPANITRSFNTSFMISATHDCDAHYTIGISATGSVISTQTGTAFLEISSDNTTWTTISQATNAITMSVSSGTMIDLDVRGIVLKNYYIRIRTSGTATLTYRLGRETIL
jgi:hypothetical protein